MRSAILNLAVRSVNRFFQMQEPVPVSIIAISHAVPVRYGRDVPLLK